MCVYVKVPLLEDASSATGLFHAPYAHSLTHTLTHSALSSSVSSPLVFKSDMRSWQHPLPSSSKLHCSSSLFLVCNSCAVLSPNIASPPPHPPLPAATTVMAEDGPASAAAAEAAVDSVTHRNELQAMTPSAACDFLPLIWR